MPKFVIASSVISLVVASNYPPPAGSFAVTESSYNLGGFLCGNKETEASIWYPSTLSAGPFPIVSYGHGMGGQMITDLIKSVASLGIVVVAPATSGGKCDDNHWKDMLHAIEGSKAAPSLHQALQHVDWTTVGIMGHSMGGYASLNGAADVLSNPSKYSFSLTAMLDSHGYIGDYAASAAKITIPAMFTTGSEDHASRLAGAFNAAPTKTKVLAQAAGADHMWPQENGSLNPFDAHFFGCHLLHLQMSCDKVYGNAADSLCKANSMTVCEVVNDGPTPQPTPKPTPSPTPTPTPTPLPVPTPTPSPIPGGDPSEDCLKCWQSACSSVEQAACPQCMRDVWNSKGACIDICKPSLFGEKMINWFCNAQLEVIV